MLGMPDYWLNRRAPFEQFAQLRGEIAPSGDVDCHGFWMIVLPAKALIDKRLLGPDSRQPLDLRERGFQGRPIIGIVGCGIDPDNPPSPGGGDETPFAPKLVVLGHFAFGNALYLRGMDTIDLPVISALLGPDPPRDTRDLPLLHRQLQLPPLHIAQHPPQRGAQFAGFPPRPFELPRGSIPSLIH